MAKTRLVLLGATGSIGTQTLDVVRMHADEIELVALACGHRVEDAVRFAREFGCKHLAFGDDSVRDATALNALDADVQVDYGPSAVEALTQLDDVDIVLNALSGEAGMRASYATLKAGRVLALANKESLVVGGELIMPLATHETMLPVDSEHSAIYQCYLGENPTQARRIWLTCSGGPFRGKTRDDIARVTAREALAHPTWNMGPKITIDSATLMNKGLEVIEAQHLFGVCIDDIRVVVHPQSCVHSMVEYVDGSVKAHLGVADMRIPIQFALSYPDRWQSPAEQVDFTKMHALEFLDPDLETFRCLALALEAGRAKGTLPCVMNAANEIAVAAFLQDRCRIVDIDRIVEQTMNAFDVEDVESIEQLEEVDRSARRFARELVAKGVLQ